MQDATRKRLERLRKGLLWSAFALALLLLALDRGAAWLHRPGPESTAVVIYTTGWCPYCKVLRSHLAARGVAFTDHDVEHSLAGAMGFWTLRGRGVPVSVIGPEVIYGFDLPRIEAALGRLGHGAGNLPPEAASGAPDKDPG